MRKGRKTYEEECQVEVGQSCPCKKQVDGVVDELDLGQLSNAQLHHEGGKTYLKPNLAEEVLTRSPYPPEKYSGMD